MTRPRLRILQIDLGKGWAGGQTQSLALAQGLATRGQEVIFVCHSEGELARRLKDLQISAVPMPVSGRSDLIALSRLLRLLREKNPHIIHTHDSVAFWLAGLAARLSRKSARVVIHKRTDHPPASLGRLRYRLLADSVIAISRAAEVCLLEAGVSPRKIVMIYSSIDCSWFKPDAGELASEFRKTHDLKPEWPLLGSAGELVTRKGHIYLLESAQIILQTQPEARFLIAGDGPLRNSLENHAEALGIKDRVIFLGEIKDIRPLLASLCAFVMPSLAEGLGVVALEAMAMGVPVIASKVGGLCEVVEDGRTGFLAAPGKPGEIAAAVLRLLQNKNLQTTMGENARKRAELLFSRETMIAKTEAVYYSLLSSFRGRK